MEKAQEIIKRFCKRFAQVFALDAKLIPESEIKTWKSMENGTHFPVKNGETTAESAKKFLKEKKQTQPSGKFSPAIAAYCKAKLAAENGRNSPNFADLAYEAIHAKRKLSPADQVAFAKMSDKDIKEAAGITATAEPPKKQPPSPPASTQATAPATRATKAEQPKSPNSTAPQFTPTEKGIVDKFIAAGDIDNYEKLNDSQKATVDKLAQMCIAFKPTDDEGDFATESEVFLHPNAEALYADYQDLMAGKKDLSGFKKYDAKKMAGKLQSIDFDKSDAEVAHQASRLNFLLSSPDRIKEYGLDLASPEQLYWLDRLLSDSTTPKDPAAILEYMKNIRDKAASSFYKSNAAKLDKKYAGTKIDAHIPDKLNNKFPATSHAWGTQPGTYTVFRSGDLNNPNGIYTANSFEGASAYSTGSAYHNIQGIAFKPRSTVEAYEVDIKRPYVAASIEEAYQKLFTRNLPKNWQKNWSQIDAEINKALKKRGYDAFVMQRPNKKELVYLGDPNSMRMVGSDLTKENQLKALRNR